jgi:hypothetical protein
VDAERRDATERTLRQLRRTILIARLATLEHREDRLAGGIHFAALACLDDLVVEIVTERVTNALQLGELDLEHQCDLTLRHESQSVVASRERDVEMLTLMLVHAETLRRRGTVLEVRQCRTLVALRRARWRSLAGEHQVMKSLREAIQLRISGRHRHGAG